MTQLAFEQRRKYQRSRLTPEEEAAIDAYDGPVTKCPPETFSWQVAGEDIGSSGWFASTRRRQVTAHNARQTKAAAERKAEVWAMLAQGKTQEQVARLLKVNIATVRYDLHEGMDREKSGEGLDTASERNAE